MQPQKGVPRGLPEDETGSVSPGYKYVVGVIHIELKENVRKAVGRDRREGAEI